MIDKNDVSEKQINDLYERLKKEAEDSGYNLNPDIDITKELVKGLIINEKRYGHQSCPCRLAAGKKKEDIDIICPCDYRDPDLNDYDTCYCALYVSTDVVKGKKTAEPIPERRPSKEKREGYPTKGEKPLISSLSMPIWRCKVCGYLCAREGPPEICPICKAKRDRFEKFL